MYRRDFSPVLDNAGLLLSGLGNTLTLTAAALACGLPVGLALAAARLSGRRILSVPAGVIIEVFRTTPPLVQLFWFYFGLPIILNVEMTPFLAALLTFCIQSGAFFAEIFRAGIVSIDQGQREAGRAIGMTHAQCFWRIVLPQAVKRMFPAFMESSIELMKTTTLVSLPVLALERIGKRFGETEVFSGVDLTVARGDPHGFVASCNSTNFFIVRRGELWTSTGAFSFKGLTRQAVLDAWRASGRVALEKQFTLAETYGADEAFVTGTLGGITPVTRIDGRSIGTGEPGPMTARASDLYQAWVVGGPADSAS
jgi:polar amino acid transport system permease protein